MLVGRRLKRRQCKYLTTDKMKIPKELTPSIFKISKKVFEKKLTFKEGQQILVGDYKMNPNSAADYINNFRCMIEGIRFTRTNNAYSMEYFFDNIYKEYGSLKLSNALTALRLHISEYSGQTEPLNPVKLSQ